MPYVTSTFIRADKSLLMRFDLISRFAELDCQDRRSEQECLAGRAGLLSSRAVVHQSQPGGMKLPVRWVVGNCRAAPLQPAPTSAATFPRDCPEGSLQL